MGGHAVTGFHSSSGASCYIFVQINLFNQVVGCPLQYPLEINKASLHFHKEPIARLPSHRVPGLYAIKGEQDSQTMSSGSIHTAFHMETNHRKLHIPELSCGNIEGKSCLNCI